MSASGPALEAAARVGANILTSLRFTLWIAQLIGLPTLSGRIDHSHPSLARSVGFLAVPSPPHGLL